MKDDRPNKAETPGTQRRGEWSQQEITTLKSIARGKPRAQQLLTMFPGRSLGAIKLKLSHIRRELGLPKRGICANLKPALFQGPAMVPPDEPPIYAPSWQQAMRPSFMEANARYLAALQAAA